MRAHPETRRGQKLCLRSSGGGLASAGIGSWVGDSGGGAWPVGCCCRTAKVSVAAVEVVVVVEVEVEVEVVVVVVVVVAV